MEETAGRGVRNDRLIWKRQQGTAGCEECVGYQDI